MTAERLKACLYLLGFVLLMGVVGSIETGRWW